MRTHRVVVLFDDDEFHELLKSAGDVPLSVYLRKMGLWRESNSFFGSMHGARKPRDVNGEPMELYSKEDLKAVAEIIGRKPLLSADDVRASLDARRAAPVDMKKILP